MKNKYCLIFNGILILMIIQISSAATVYKGSLHQHTGFSTTSGGYDSNILTGDDCEVLLEGHPNGKNVTELRDQALNLGLDYLGFSDHSYCIDGSDFDTVKIDCENARNSTFTCLVGEEVSVHDELNLEGGEK